MLNFKKIMWGSWDNHRHEDRLDVFESIKTEMYDFSLVETDREWNYSFSQAKQVNVIYFVLGGDGWIGVDSKKIHLRKSHVYLYPRNLPVTLGCERGITKYYMQFRMELIPGQDLLDFLSEPVDLGPFSESMKVAFDAMNYVEPNAADYLFLKSVCLELVGRLGEPFVRHFERERRKLSEFHDFFRHLSDPPSAVDQIQEIAKRLNMTHSTLTRRFKKSFGSTPKEYLYSRLDQHAKRLLLTTQLTVAQIADVLEFVDASHFSHFFKRLNGMAPGKFRKTSRRSWG